MLEKKKESRDKGARMTDTDTPYKPGYGVTPGDQNHDPPHPHAVRQQHRHTQKQQHDQHRAEQQTGPPPPPPARRKDKAVDAVGDRAVAMVMAEQGWELVLDKRRLQRLGHGSLARPGFSFGTV